MGNSNPIHPKRKISVLLVCLVLLSLACNYGTLEAKFLNGDEEPAPVDATLQALMNQKTVYSSTGHAEITYKYATIPSDQFNVCNDDISKARVTFY
jgi:hypothetical protein